MSCLICVSFYARKQKKMIINIALHQWNIVMGVLQAWGQVHGAKYKYNYFAKLQVQVQVLISRVKYKYKYFEKLQVQVQVQVLL